MWMTTWAILNGDDFGLSPGVNRGIIEAHRAGLLTSASIMVVGDAFEEAVALAREHPDLALGLHLTLIEGRPVLPPEQIPSLVTRDGRFVDSLGGFLRRWVAGRIRLPEVQRECEAQVEKALHHRLQLTKLDSHMHVHMLPGIFQATLGVAKRHGLQAVRLPRERIQAPRGNNRLVSLWRRIILTSLSALHARLLARAGLFAPDYFAGVVESGHLTEEGLLRILRALKPGVTEIMVHPGYRDSTLEGWVLSHRYNREQELAALTSSKVKALVQELRIELVSYRTAVYSLSGDIGPRQ